MRKYTSAILLFLLLFSCIESFAVRAIREPFNILQPDGSQLTIYLNGDEFYHYHSTSDGYMIKKDNKGYYRYLTIDKTGALIESNFIARNPTNRTISEKGFLKTINQSEQLKQIEITRHAKQLVKKSPETAQAQQSFPVTGSPKTLIILVGFSDKAFTVPTPQTAFGNLLNQTGYSANGGTGSAKDYFISASYAKFSPVFDVVGPYTLPQNMAYYGANNVNNEDQNPRQMVIDACTLASQNGVNFSQYDTNSDGFVDNVFIYYAGNNEAEGASASTIWPHRWTLANYNTQFNGKTVFDYACTSELRGAASSTMCGIGTFCHEFGHVIGLPDYYHTSDGNKQTLGAWSIMDYGSYNNSGRTPPTYSTYDRFFLGWINPQQIGYASRQTLQPIYQGSTTPASTSQQSYLLANAVHNMDGANPSPAEFFILEYRKKTAWDTYLPAEGMLAWHIDYNATAWADNSPNNYTGSSQTAGSHMRVYLQPLSGSSITPGTAFSSGSFNPTNWAGTDINRAISNISKTATELTFDFMGASQINVSELAGASTTDILVESGIRLNSDAQGSTVKSVTVSPGGSVNFNNAITINGDLLLKADNTSSFNATVGAGATITGNLKYIKTMDDTHWYFLAFPCNVPISGIKKSDGSSIGVLGTDWFIKYYDGATRTVNLGVSSNWVNITNTALSLEAYKGYAIGLKTGTVEVSFPLSKTLFASENSKTVPVVAYGNSLNIGENHKGWNLISQPYVSKYNSTNAGLNYMIFPADDAAQTFQTTLSNSGMIIEPFKAFFVQANAGMEAAQISFATIGRQTAPESVTATTSNLIRLNLQSNTGTDYSGLIIDDNTLPNYVIGEDMEKWIGTGTPKPQLYTIKDGINFSYNAIPSGSVQNLNVGYYTQSAGELTISTAENQGYSGTELYLTDKLTGITTNIIANSYTFTSVAGTTNQRFVLNTSNLSTLTQAIEGNVEIMSENRIIKINGIEAGSLLKIFNSVGKCIVTTQDTGNYAEIRVPEKGVYVVNIYTSGKLKSRKILVQ